MARLRADNTKTKRIVPIGQSLINISIRFRIDSRSQRKDASGDFRSCKQRWRMVGQVCVEENKRLQSRTRQVCTLPLSPTDLLLCFFLTYYYSLRNGLLIFWFCANSVLLITLQQVFRAGIANRQHATGHV